MVIFKRQRLWTTTMAILRLFVASIVLTTTSIIVNAAEPGQHRLVISPAGDQTNQPAKQPFVLTCRGSGDQPNLFTDLKWFDPRGEEITSYYTRDRNPDIRTEELYTGHLFLQFQKPRPDDSGTYKCKGFIQSSEPLEAQIQVQFFDDVTWDDCPEIQALIAGESNEIIRCRASANPKPNIQWRKDSKPIEGDNRYSINSDGVRINGPVDDTDGGRYHVRALVTETGRLHDRYVTVQVYVRPQIVALNGLSKGIEDEPSTLECSATGSPPPVFTWLDPGRRNLSQIAGYLVNRDTGHLTISKVNRINDRGEFTCIAENSAGRVERKALFQVVVRPRINQFQNVSYDVGKESRIECRSSGEPRPDITVRRDGSDRPLVVGDPKIGFERRFENEESVLVVSIFNTQRTDDGLYYCRAENEAGHAETVGHLQVRFRPDMSKTPTAIVKTWDMRPANLTCVAESIPNATIHWYYRGQQIFNGIYENLYTIDESIAGVSQLIVKPTASHGVRDIYGQYKCIAENSLGRGEISIQLDQAHRPGSVTARVSAITPTTVVFMLDGPSFDGGLPVKRVVVQYWPRHQVDHITTKEWPVTGATRLSSVGGHGPYTIENLWASTDYIFKFAAQNDVGTSDFSIEQLARTLRESPPERPQFRNVDKRLDRDEVISPYANQMRIQWSVPRDNGRAIEYFEIKYYPILPLTDSYQQVGETKMASISANDDQSTEYTIRELKPNTYYRIELRAHNEVGFSEPGLLEFRTAETGFYQDPQDQVATSSPSLGLIIAVILVIIVILLVLMDVTFYLRYRVGALYFLRSHVCVADPGGDGHKVAKSINDGKNSQKSHADSERTEVDNPAFDDRRSPTGQPPTVVHEEQRPMMANGSSGAKGDPSIGLGSRTSVAKDSAV